MSILSDPVKLKAATDEVLAQIPGLEGFVEATRLALTNSIQQVVQATVASLADGISQIVALGYSVDGATVNFEMQPIQIPSISLQPIQIPPINAKLTISMPVKGVGK